MQQQLEDSIVKFFEAREKCDELYDLWKQAGKQEEKAEALAEEAFAKLRQPWENLSEAVMRLVPGVQAELILGAVPSLSASLAVSWAEGEGDENSQWGINLHRWQGIPDISDTSKLGEYAEWASSTASQMGQLSDRAKIMWHDEEG